MTARVKSRLWVQAYMRRLASLAAPSYVVRRGDADAGAIAVKVIASRGAARLFLQSIGEDGASMWREIDCGGDEARADARLAREIDIDPDLWIVEVEDKDGAHHLLEPVQEMPHPE
ncbi:MAG: DUF1491 family protein [Parvularculaceae bacterium]